jgi:hypothetical protein
MLTFRVIHSIIDLYKKQKNKKTKKQKNKIIKAIQRPKYLNKSQQQKFWEIQIEEVVNGDHNCYFHIFNCPKRASLFADKNNICFYPKQFYYSTIEEETKKRATKHF